jgi:hypothetical protein
MQQYYSATPDLQDHNHPGQKIKSKKTIWISVAYLLKHSAHYSSEIILLESKWLLLNKYFVKIYSSKLG